MRESTIEKAVCKWAKDQGIQTLKLQGPGARGKADRLFWKGTKVAWVEIKSPGKKPTALQVKFIRDRWADGFHAEYFDNAPAAIEWLRQIYEIPYDV